MKDTTKEFLEKQLDNLLDTERRFIEQLASLALWKPERIPLEIKQHNDVIEKKKIEIIEFMEQMIAQEQKK